MKFNLLYEIVGHSFVNLQLLLLKCHISSNNILMYTTYYYMAFKKNHYRSSYAMSAQAPVQPLLAVRQWRTSDTSLLRNTYVFPLI